MPRPYHLFDQFCENRQTLPDHLQADTIAQPEIAGAAEAVTGDQQQVLLLGLFGKCHRIAARGLHKKIESTVRLNAFVSVCGEVIIEEISVFFVCLNVYLCIDAM